MVSSTPRNKYMIFAMTIRRVNILSSKEAWNGDAFYWNRCVKMGIKMIILQKPGFNEKIDDFCICISKQMLDYHRAYAWRTDQHLLKSLRKMFMNDATLVLLMKPLSGKGGRLEETSDYLASWAMNGIATWRILNSNSAGSPYSR